MREIQASEAKTHLPQLLNDVERGETILIMTEAETASFLRNRGQLSIDVDRVPTDAGLLTLARQHRLTVYDAAYLELAQREGLALATLDTALRQAAKAAGVPLLADAA